jgi:signal transduction histidine kinase
MISHAATSIARGADELASGALAELTRAMRALEHGDLDAAHARAEVKPIKVHSRDELGKMAESFNTMQSEVAAAVLSLGGARQGLIDARAQLEDQNTHLVKLDRAKDEFIGLVSHELRTPLTSIHGYLELIQDPHTGKLNADQQHYIDVIDRNSLRLLRLVGDLLLVAQSDAGALVLAVEDVRISALVTDCVESALPTAVDSNVALELDAEPDLIVNGDPVRLAQVFDNLVSNAIKFTPAGGRVNVRLLQAEHLIRLEVCDTGIGISATEQANLFTRFYRTKQATEQAIQGTGLGLTIAKAIVEGHDGTIAVESAPGRGTTMVVELAAVPAAVALTA